MLVIRADVGRLRKVKSSRKQILLCEKRQAREAKNGMRN